VPAIGRDSGQRLGRSLEQQSIDLGLILVGHRTDRGRKLEYEMKMRHREQFGFARRQPCRRSRPLAFRASPITAAAVGDDRVRAVLAAFDMTTERGGATNLDCRHHTSLGEAHVAGIGRTPRLTMSAEDIRHLELRPEHLGLASARGRRLNVREFEWALNFSDHVDGSPAFGGEVAHGGLHRQSPRHLNGIDPYGYCKRLGDRPGQSAGKPALVNKVNHFSGGCAPFKSGAAVVHESRPHNPRRRSADGTQLTIPSETIGLSEIAS